MEIEIRDQRFELLHQKGVFWKDTRTLLIGDLHLGKITHFRKEGIAAPSAALENNFTRLDEMVVENKAERIILLGDLFHSRYNKEWERFAEWRKKYAEVQINIVPGNHDILPRQLFDASKIIIQENFSESQFLFAHHPVDESAGPNFIFCGHIHPVYCLHSGGKQHLKLPCFVMDAHQMILPSFGIFTGGYEMHVKPGRKIFVIAGKTVIQV